MLEFRSQNVSNKIIQSHPRACDDDGEVHGDGGGGEEAAGAGAGAGGGDGGQPLQRVR
jgi:hypothetical protein